MSDAEDTGMSSAPSDFDDDDSMAGKPLFSVLLCLRPVARGRSLLF